jgi:tetratricopeptide (TPR) repeat protein
MVKRTALLVVAAVMAVLVVQWFRLSTAVAATSATRQICDPKADFYLGIEDYPQAVRLHRAFLAKHPGDALAHYHLGFAYGMLGERSAELRQYREAVALGLTHWDLFLNLGLAEMENGNLNAAANDFRVSVLLGPTHPESHFNLGLVDERLGLLTEAEQQMLASLELDPTQLGARNMLGIIYARLSDTARATSEWRALIRDAPGYGPARDNLDILEHQPVVTASGGGQEVAFTRAEPAAR